MKSYDDFKHDINNIYKLEEIEDIRDSLQNYYLSNPISKIGLRKRYKIIKYEATYILELFLAILLGMIGSFIYEFLGIKINLFISLLLSVVIAIVIAITVYLLTRSIIKRFKSDKVVFIHPFELKLIEEKLLSDYKFEVI